MVPFFSNTVQHCNSFFVFCCRTSSAG